MIGFVGGTCSGFAIPFAKSIGAKNTEDSQKYLWNGCRGICIATPLAWFLAMVYCGILVRHFLGQRCRAAV